MVEWLIVISLIILGISLIIIEIIFVPGTTVVGFVGFGVAGYGVFLGFVNFGTTTGVIILISAIILCIISLVISFKSGVWKKLSLHKSIDSKVNEEFKIDLQVEQRGIAVSALRPVGKAEFNDREYEVQTIGDYVSAGSPVKIISIKERKIYVEPLK